MTLSLTRLMRMREGKMAGIVETELDGDPPSLPEEMERAGLDLAGVRRRPVSTEPRTVLAQEQRSESSRTRSNTHESRK